MARPRIAIVDTGSGNLRSVEKALSVAGGDGFVTRDADLVASADKVVTPGQGAFGDPGQGTGRRHLEQPGDPEVRHGLHAQVPSHGAGDCDGDIERHPGQLLRWRGVS